MIPKADFKGKDTQLSYLTDRTHHHRVNVSVNTVVSVPTKTSIHFGVQATCHDETMKHQILGDSRDRRLRQL